jgi:hypothetical protein
MRMGAHPARRGDAGAEPRGPEPLQEPPDQRVVYRFGSQVEGTHGVERLRNVRTDNLIDLTDERQARFPRTDRCRRHHAGRPLSPHRARRGDRRGAGGEAVVHHDDRAPLDDRLRTRTAVALGADAGLVHLGRRHGVQGHVRYRQLPDDLLVQEDPNARRHRAQLHLRRARHHEPA